MANIKFSGFTNTAMVANTQLVGYVDGDTTANYRYDITQLATGLITALLAANTGLTTGSVLFVGAAGIITQDNTNFFWDDSNNRLGIGVNAPDNTLEVLSTTAQIKVSYDGSNDTVFAVDSAGDFTITPSGGSSKIVGQGYTSLKSGVTNMTFNWDEGNVQMTTLAAGSHTFTPSSPKTGATYIITIAQTGAATVNWNSLVKFPGNTDPTLSGNTKTDVITLICYDQTANTGAGAYYGNSALDFTT